MRAFCLFALALVEVGMATHAVADEHAIETDGAGPSFVRWVYGGRRSATVGAEAKPGVDGGYRLHVRVKNGDYVLFAHNEPVLFENGEDEIDQVWEVAAFLNGQKATLRPIQDKARRNFYVNPDQVLMSAPVAGANLMVLIHIKQLRAGRPILFASGRVSHLSSPQGTKHFGFGAIELDDSKSK